MKSLGVNPRFVDTSSGFYPGDVGYTDDARRFMYLEAAADINGTDACELRMDTGTAYRLDESEVSGESGNQVGVAFSPLAAGEFGWFQIYGVATVRTVDASVSEGAEVYPSSTAGALATGASGRPVDGILITTAGMNNLAVAVLSDPKIAASTATGTGSSNVPDKPSTPSNDTEYNLKITSGGSASWVEDAGASSQDDTARASATAALAAAQAAQTTADSKSDVPNKPDDPSKATNYHMHIQTDGSASWEENTATDTGLPEAPSGEAATAIYNLRIMSDGAADWALDMDASEDTNAIALTQVGDPLMLTSNAQGNTTTGAVEGPEMSTLENVIFLSFTYDRGGTFTRTHKFNTFFLKSDVGADSDNPGWIQLQGSGEADVSIYVNDDNLTFGPIPTAFTNASVRVFNTRGVMPGEGGGAGINGGTREPDNDIAADGSDGDWWVYGGGNGNIVSIWENVEGNWVEIGRATDSDEAVENLQHLTRDLHVTKVVTEWENAADTDGDLAWYVPVNNQITINDSDFDNQGAEMTIPASNTARTTYVFVRLPIAADHVARRVFVSNGSVYVQGNHWALPLDEGVTEGTIDKTTYQYWMADINLNETSAITTRLEKRETIEKTSYTGKVPGTVTIVDALPDTIPDIGTALILRDPVGIRDEGVYVVKSHGGDYYEGDVVNAIDSVIAVQANLDNNPNGSISEIEWTLNGLHMYVEFHNSAFTGSPPADLYLELTHLDTSGGAIGTADELSSGDQTNSRITLARQASFDRLGHYSYGNQLSGATMTLWGGVDAGERIRFKVYTDSAYSTPLVNAGGKYYDLITEDKFPHQMALARLAQGDATDGQVLVWDNDNNVWSPTTTVPAGGTAAQILTKASGDDYDLQWADPSASSSAVDSVARAAATAAQTTATAALPKAGGTMTGKITLDGAPTSDLHASTKKYVNDEDAKHLPLAGGGLTGPLTLIGDPTNNLHAATKQYVDDNAGGDEGLSDLDTLPDVDDYDLEDIIAVDDRFYKLSITDETTANLYEGTVGRSSITLGDEHWRGIANSQSPNGFSTDGGWTANPENAISLIMAGNSRHIRVAIKKSVYETAKGSAFLGTDKIAVKIIFGDSDTDEAVLAYYNSYSRDTTYLVWQHRHATDNYNLYSETAGNAITVEFFTVDAMGVATTTPFLTHIVGLKHWIEWRSHPDEGIGAVALEKAEANTSRIATLEQNEGKIAANVRPAPIVNITLDASNVELSHTAFTRSIPNLQSNDLIVITYENFHTFGFGTNHKKAGSTDAAGTISFRVHALGTTYISGEMGKTTGFNRKASDNSDDPQFSRSNIEMERAGTGVVIEFNADTISNLNNFAMIPPANFEFNVQVFRGVGTANITLLETWVGTDAQYTDLATKDDSTLYITTAT